MKKRLTLLAIAGSLLVAGLYSETSYARSLNEEYGLAVVFPGKLKACISYSGDHAHGFFSIAQESKATCGSASYADKYLTAYAEYNTAYQRFGKNIFADCLGRKSVPKEVYAEFSRAKNFANAADIVCIAKYAGSYSLYIYRQSRKTYCCAADGPKRGVPAIFYYVRLTPRSHVAAVLRDDMNTFRRFYQSWRVAK